MVICAFLLLRFCFFLYVQRVYLKRVHCMCIVPANPVEGIISPGTGLNRHLLATVWGLRTESRSPVLLNFVLSLHPSMQSS